MAKVVRAENNGKVKEIKAVGLVPGDVIEVGGVFMCVGSECVCV